MLHIPFILLKTTHLRSNLSAINKNSLETNTSKTDGTLLHGGAHTQYAFRTFILNLDGIKSHPQV